MRTQPDPEGLVRLLQAGQPLHFLVDRRLCPAAVASDVAKTDAPTGAGTMSERSQTMAEFLLR